MKDIRQELIDFLEWYHKEPKLTDKNPRFSHQWVDEYLSINSAPLEREIVIEKKGEKKVNKCEYCGSTILGYYGKCKCFSKSAGSDVY